MSKNLDEDATNIIRSMVPNETRSIEWNPPAHIHFRSSKHEDAGITSTGKQKTFGDYGDFSERLHVEVISPETKARIRDFYAVDYECLGF